mmetsp:Transcript_3689/g.5996  ORF Transcript_3689/g.5996 Transcript_3689/m.5996 type:complete len:175 (+) Transcript_3689:1-525(+)|eukprot:CAMPEP_0168586692 /NCGR_PEP_ID=MMETSP0420-20121227/4436_1 /TAXON_ID=498008 /ORGANISM="Pessonella sp." /LENGTH=174 /DNA_ID=CAMNT_0008621833 /DNA_START=1 /DNA_END=525 /DNA_ORIENTATION=-
MNSAPASISQEQPHSTTDQDSYISRITAPFTQCFGVVSQSPVVTRATEISTPYYEWVANKILGYVRVIRGDALAEPLVDSDDDNDDNDVQLGASQSYLSQSDMAGSIFTTPNFPPTVAQSSLQKSYNEYNPPSLVMSTTSSTNTSHHSNDPHANADHSRIVAPSPSMVLESQPE